MNEVKKEHTTLDKVLNIVSIIICVLVVLVAINGLVAQSKGYNSFFGSAYYAVKTESMKGTNANSFNKGDIIFVSILKSDDAKNLTVGSTKDGSGDIITYWTTIDGQKVLNSHRIIGRYTKTTGEFSADYNGPRKNGEGDSMLADGEVYYITKGDNNEAFDNTPVKSDSVIGKYTGKWVGVGNVVLFLQSSTGFLVCVVVPSLLVLAYAIYDFIRSYKVYHSEKVAVDEVALKEKLRAEILAENASSTQKQNEEKVEDNVEPKVEEPKTETENSTPVQKDNDNKDNK